MAPEYALHGLFSIKSDVFSYGVLVLEIISGQKNSYFRDGQTVEDLLSFVSTQNISSLIRTHNICNVLLSPVCSSLAFPYV